MTTGPFLLKVAGIDVFPVLRVCRVVVLGDMKDIFQNLHTSK